AEIPPRPVLAACREKGSEAVIRHVHGMAVPADGRCVRVDGPGGEGAAAGVPVVPGAGGVLVWLLAACPPAGAGAEDLHSAGAVPRLRGESCAAAGVRPGPAAGRGGVGGPGDRAGRGRGGELAVSFSALAAELGGEGGAAAAGSAAGGCGGDRRGVHGGGRAAGLGGAGAVAVRLRGDRREPAGRQRVL